MRGKDVAALALGGRFLAAPPYFAAAESKKRTVCISRSVSTPQLGGDLTPPLRSGSGAVSLNGAPL